MTDVTVVSTPTTSEETAIAENAPVVTEVVADASVEIAQIEADKEIAIAEIHAETRAAETEVAAAAMVEAAAFDAQAELGSCRQSIETLQTELTGIKETQASILSRLTEQTPRSQPPAEGESLEATPANPEEAEPPPMEKPTRKKRFRLI